MPLKPHPYREVKRCLIMSSFDEYTQKGSTSIRDGDNYLWQRLAEMARRTLVFYL